jgi:hypothetical protein
MIIKSISPSGNLATFKVNYFEAGDVIFALKRMGFHTFSFSPEGKKGHLSPSNFSECVKMIHLINAINVRNSLTAALDIRA